MYSAKQKLAAINQEIAEIEARYTHQVLGHTVRTFELMTDAVKSELRILRLQQRYTEEYIEAGVTETIEMVCDNEITDWDLSPTDAMVTGILEDLIAADAE